MLVLPTVLRIWWVLSVTQYEIRKLDRPVRSNSIVKNDVLQVENCQISESIKVTEPRLEERHHYSVADI